MSRHRFVPIDARKPSDFTATVTFECEDCHSYLLVGYDWNTGDKQITLTLQPVGCGPEGARKLDPVADREEAAEYIEELKL
jgi:hypothetical protein